MLAVGARAPRRRARRDRGHAGRLPRAARLRARRLDPVQLADRRRPVRLAGLGHVRRQRAAGRRGRHVDLADVLARGGELALGVFALGIVVVPALRAERDRQARRDVVVARCSSRSSASPSSAAARCIEQDLDALALRNALPILVVCVAGAPGCTGSCRGMRADHLARARSSALIATGVGAWIAMQRLPVPEPGAGVRARVCGTDQDGTNSIGGFRVGRAPRSRWQPTSTPTSAGARRSSPTTPRRFGVILLSGRPEVFFDRVDKGDDGLPRRRSGTVRAGRAPADRQAVPAT